MVENPKLNSVERYFPFSHLFPQNRSNFVAHFEGTGPEIWRQTNGIIDAFVAGAGKLWHLLLVHSVFTRTDIRCHEPCQWHGQYVVMTCWIPGWRSQQAKWGRWVFCDPPFACSHPFRANTSILKVSMPGARFLSSDIFACVILSAARFLSAPQLRTEF